MNKHLLYGVSLCLLLTACTTNKVSTEVRYKQMTNEWPQPHCTDYGKDTTEERTIMHQTVGDDRFGFEVCAIQSMSANEEYKGPVALRIIDLATSKILMETKWDSYRSSSNTMSVGADKAFMNFSDGKNTFGWEANATQLAEASAIPKTQVLDYVNCTRSSIYADKKGKAGFMFEECYTTSKGLYDEARREEGEGVIRLTAYPGGRELKVQRLEKMDIQNVAFLFDQRKIQFESNGQKIEWELPSI